MSTFNQKVSADQRIIAIIPARGGSKGLPGKNLKEIEGISLVQRAINSAKLCNKIDLVVISTDDNQILNQTFSHDVHLHKRSSYAATDTAKAADVIWDLLENNSVLNIQKEDVVVYLQPTSPFRTYEHVSEAIDLFFSSQRKSCISVKHSKELPQKTLKIDGNGELIKPDWDVSPSSNRQLMDRFVYPNGAIYIFRIDEFLDSNDFPIIGGIPYLMSTLASIDVDDEDDLHIARGLARYATI